MAEPSGNGLGIELNYLKSSAPFKNFLIPGIVLFTCNDLLSIIIRVFTIKRNSNYPLFLNNQGTIFVAWIAIQLSMVTSFHVLHIIISMIGVVLIFIGLRLRAQ